jgi:hypothetical protein
VRAGWSAPYYDLLIGLFLGSGEFVELLSPLPLFFMSQLNISLDYVAQWRIRLFRTMFRTKNCILVEGFFASMGFNPTGIINLLRKL